VKLYSEQAARGSTSGVNSLRRVAIALTRDEARLAAAIDHPRVQRLLSAYLIQRLDQLSELEDEFPSDEGPSDVVKHEGLLRKLLRAIEQRGLQAVEGADVLAALSYRSGKYQLASKLARQSQTPFRLG